MKNNYRIECDTLGEVKVEDGKFWGAQTERSLHNFKIGNLKMPPEIIKALALSKKAAAFSNHDLGVLSEEKRDMIAKCCDEILDDSLSKHFPLSVWQTGSGTQTNMNVNEVIANRSEILHHGEIKLNKWLSPNDDVNKSQSTNDMFPTAICIATAKLLYDKTIPEIEAFILSIKEKEIQFNTIKKIGRTHLMDATPLQLSEEFSAYRSQMEHSILAIKSTLPHLMELPVGGTAVGNGINTPVGYDKLTVSYINQFTGLNFTPAANKFEKMAAMDSLVAVSSMLKRTAVSLMKIANDIRLLGSGPRCGIGEIILPANEPGSSIMPGKVNPTQCEALSMVCCQIIGNDAAITAGALQGQLQLNVFMPMIGYNLIQSAQLLADVINSFNLNCMSGIQPNLENIDHHLHNSLMLVTALNPHIGYHNAAKIAQYAFDNHLTLKEAALKLELVSETDFDQWISF